MKKINKLFLFLFGIVYIWSFAFADMIPENSHSFSRCVKIENIDSVSWYKLVIRVQTAPWEDYFYEVVTWECLPHHYKFGTATPILLNSTINVEELNQQLKGDKQYVENLLWFETVWKFDAINVNWGYVSDRSNKTYENDTYRLAVNDSWYELDLINIETDETPVTNTAWVTKISLKKIGPNNNYFIQFLESRLLTIFLETIMLFFICKLFLKKENLKNRKIILTWILASSITLPLLWFIFPLFFKTWLLYAIIWEILVFLLEIIIIKYLLKINRKNAILASLICNLFSLIIWLLI